MPTPAFSLARVLKMRAHQRTQYFYDFSRYLDDAPNPDKQYTIRIGSTTLYAPDTHLLWERFDAFLERSAV